MGMRVPALYFTLCELWAKLITVLSWLWLCILSLCCHCPVLLPPLHWSWSWPSGGVSQFSQADRWKPAILYPNLLHQSPGSWQAAYCSAGEGSQCRDCMAALWALIPVPALLGCHKPLLCSEQASPPSWEIQGLLLRSLDEWKELRATCLYQNSMGCLGFASNGLFGGWRFNRR